MRNWLILFIAELVVHFAGSSSGLLAQQFSANLQAELSSENAESLADAAELTGDAARGAAIFYRQQLACALCHTSGASGGLLGPELAQNDETRTGAYLVESLLHPSKFIKKGFQATTVVTSDGRRLSGLVVEEDNDTLSLRQMAGPNGLVRVSQQDVDERAPDSQSIMPEGMVNHLSGRQEFLDLVKYLMVINEHGRDLAEELQPLLASSNRTPIAEYEKDIDHAGLISKLGQDNFERGEAIYERLCVNCHGTRDRPGSLPNSLRFAAGRFKNGSDPYGMYRTLTYGFGMMVPESWMVPQQKYDVIHYIREAYLKDSKSAQYVAVTDGYLRRLPKGDSYGPEPSEIEPWSSMDYGPSLIGTFEVGDDGSNIAYKGIAVRLDSGPGGVAHGRHWIVYDEDTLRAAGIWSGRGFIDWKGINFDGRHEIHPRIAGKVIVANPTMPGWANPASGTFYDSRFKGRDDRPYGPLPKQWCKFKGLYHYGDHVLLEFQVGEAKVLELPGLAESSREPVFTRQFRVEPRRHELLLQVAHWPGATIRHDLAPGGEVSEQIVFAPPTDRQFSGSSETDRQDGAIVGGLRSEESGFRWFAEDGNLRIRIPPSEQPTSFTIWLASSTTEKAALSLVTSAPDLGPQIELPSLTSGGPARWATPLRTSALTKHDSGPFAVDVLAHPADNPWNCRVRFGGLDFFADGDRAALCTWDGDVWTVTGLSDSSGGLTWRRIASGLFQPLGLRIVEGEIYVACRDQIVILHDRNGDGETDFYECFNNDHQVTEHFHEFAMDLQTDDAGNFYYAKAARHAKKALVPHHGTLLRVSADGFQTEILATGFRAPNGVCLNEDGTFFVTDQEGHWLPKNRINWVRDGGFYGNMWGFHDVSDTSDDAMERPICWITNEFDRSPSQLLRVNSEKWGPLKGSLLNLSYGYGKVYTVLNELVNGELQGGMCELPIPQFATGIMRGQFHPHDGQLYLCGMFAWAGNQQQDGGFYRVRYHGDSLNVPLELHAQDTGIEITFSEPVDRQVAASAENYDVETWSLKRSARYGSEHYDERSLEVANATVSNDGRTVRLTIPEIEPTWCMEIRYNLRSADGKPMINRIHSTIHRLAPSNN